MNVEMKLVVLFIALCASSTARADTTFRVRFSVAQVDDGPVRDRAWVDEQIARANTIFEPANIDFEVTDVDTLADEEGRWPEDLVTRADRHKLGPLVQPEVINVFVVKSMADVDIEGRFIRGVHWRSRRGGSPRHYVILSSIAGPTVLAHELGHFFGNPHSDTPGNIMSYLRGEGPPFFDTQQLRRIRRFTQRFIRTRELIPA